MKHMEQLLMYDTTISQPRQLLKWIGNKQRFAKKIVEAIPKDYKTYIEPFLGSGAVLGALSPRKAIAGDNLPPLIGIWELVKNDPEKLIKHYKALWLKSCNNPKKTYLEVKESFNKDQNPLDFAFLSRACFGGIIRFTKEGKMSTPIGPHKPIPPEAFRERVYDWKERIKNTTFYLSDFEKTLAYGGKGDVIYCDPPYLFCQSIIYGAQDFSLDHLWESVKKAKDKGAKVLLSIDGKKKSGKMDLNINIPPDLFERELLIDCGSSMIRRFQKKGLNMSGEQVHERLLLSW